MNQIRRPGVRQNAIALAVSFAAFVFVFLFESLLNLRIKTMQVYPTDLRSMFYGAAILGRDWTGTLSPPYYSSVSALLYALVFKYFHRGPLFMWQVILLVTTFFRCVPALISSYIAKKYYCDSIMMSFLFGVLCTLVVPTRAANLSLQPFAIAFAWLLILFVVEYFNSENKIYKGICIGGMALSAVLLSAADFLLVYTVIVVAVWFAVRSIKSKKYKELIIFTSCLAVFVLANVVLEKCLLKLAQDPSVNTYRINGTFGGTWVSVTGRIAAVFRRGGLRSYFSCIFAYIWDICVYSWGLVPMAIVLTVYSLFKKKKKNIALTEVMTLFVLFLVVALFVNSLYHFNDAQYMHKFVLPPYAGLFDIRDFAYLVGPLFFVSLLAEYPKGKKELFISRSGMFILLLSSIYIFVDLFLPYFKDNKFNLQLIFSTNPSLVLSMLSTSTLLDALFFLGKVCVIVAIVFVFITKEGYREQAVTFLSVLVVLQYLSGWIYVDGAMHIIIGDYGYVNGLTRFDTLYPEFLDSTDVLYFAGNFERRAMTQFSFNDIPVLNSLPTEGLDEFLFFSEYGIDTIWNVTDIEGCKCYCLDSENSDEYLFVKGERYISMFDDINISLIDCSEYHYTKENINRLYKVILKRLPDADGYDYWMDQFESGETSYKLAVYNFLTGSEFKSLHYNDKDLVNMMYKLFFDPNIYDDEEYLPTKEEMDYWRSRLNSDTTFNYIIEEFFQSDDCILEDLRWK